MKKIVAMILCVAMVAALGVSAFAEPITAKNKDSKTLSFTVSEWYTWLTGDGKAAAATGLKAYAEQLGTVKGILQDDIDDYNAGIKTAAKAVQAAQYATVAAYVETATALYKVAAENAINKALAEFEIALNEAIDPPAGVDVGKLFFPELNAD